MSLRLFGIRMEISVLFLASTTVMLLFDGSSIVLWTVIASFVHEIGHLISFWIVKNPPKSIAFTPFGMRLTMNKKGGQGYGKDIFTAFAGPLMNLLSFVVLWCLLAVTKNQIFSVPAFTALAIGVYNLLPVIPLDGGRILYCLFCIPFGQKRAGVIMNIVSFLILMITALFGFILLLKSRYNFTLLFTSLYLIAMLLFHSE